MMCARESSEGHIRMLSVADVAISEGKIDVAIMLHKSGRRLQFWLKVQDILARPDSVCALTDDQKLIPGLRKIRSVQ